jgi:dihydroneopterin aldolase
MADSIHIHQLEVPSFIGVYEEEQRAKQKLLISIELKVESIAAAARADDIRLTVNYSAVCATVTQVAAEKSRKLIETLAEETATAILRDYAVQEVTLEVEKFILPEARSVSVKITRRAKPAL